MSATITAGTITTSKQFWLNQRDFIKGLLTACVGAIITPLLDTLKTGTLTINWKAILVGALTAGLAYLAKNFFTPSATIITVPPIDIPVKNETPVTVVTPTPPITPIPDPHTIIINPNTETK